MISWIEKLKNKLFVGNRSPEIPTPSAAKSAPKKEYPALPATTSDAQFREFANASSEHEIMRMLRILPETETRLRLVQGIVDEDKLKRVARSDFDKKVKKAAEKRLREIGHHGAAQRHQAFALLSEEMQRFLVHPRWSEAEALLGRVFDPGLQEGFIDETAVPYLHFDEMRKRLKAEVDHHQRTVDRGHPNASKATGTVIRSTTQLEGPHQIETLPANAESSGRGRAEADAEALRKREAHELKQRQLADQKIQREKQDQLSRQKRAEALAAIQAGLAQIAERVDDRHAGSRLKQLQTQLGALKRWKREFPELFEEVETKLRNLSVTRTQVIQEGQWDAWARTDRALRIQAELEQTIAACEAESAKDASGDATWVLALGLGGRLLDYAKEMRELGRLERDKDHKIWEQFKNLTDRGWAVCDQLRLHLLEQVKSVLDEHAVKPIEYTALALCAPRAGLELKPTALESGISARIKELQNAWVQVGARRTDASREIDTVLAKLFELYFRQLNLAQGQVQRAELAAIQKKQNILREMNHACHGQVAPLLERARSAKKIAERWRQEPFPPSVSEKLQSEFAGYAAKLEADLVAELGQPLVTAAAIEAKAQAVLDKVLAKDGANLGHILKSISGHEQDLIALDKYVRQLRDVVSDAQVEARVQEALTRVREILSKGHSATQAELADRIAGRQTVLREAKALALSTDWDGARSRWEELRHTWKKVSAVGQPDDPQYDLVFEHAAKFFVSRAEAAKQGANEALIAQSVKQAKELLLCLDALTRFSESKPGAQAEPDLTLLPLPMDDQERAKAAGKVLELGMRYRQVMALDPEAGVMKETKKVMAQWLLLGMWETATLNELWLCYLNRIDVLFRLN